jgi:hypothetical protein
MIGSLANFLSWKIFFASALAFFARAFFLIPYGVNIMFHLHLDKFEIKSVRIENRSYIGSILDHRRADIDGTMDKRKGP